MFVRDFSRKGAKRCRVSKGFSLRLCAFAGEIFSVKIDAAGTRLVNVERKEL
jgi:hypothetical protein